MTTTAETFPEGAIILIYTKDDGTKRERWFRYGLTERTAAIDPPVTVTPFPGVRADEAAARYRLRGYTDIAVIECGFDCAVDGHKPMLVDDGAGAMIEKCGRCAADLEEN